MEPQVTLNVSFKNETQSFLVSDPENTTWADVEAMVSINFILFLCPLTIDSLPHSPRGSYF